MSRPCDSCGVEYEAKRPTSKYCSDRCRVRAGRGAVVKLPERRGDAIERAAEAELKTAGVLESFLGQDALRLARLVDAGKGTDAAVAALNRELRATMDAALASAKRPDSAVTQMRDELAARRAQRGA